VIVPPLVFPGLSILRCLCHRRSGQSKLDRLSVATISAESCIRDVEFTSRVLYPLTYCLDLGHLVRSSQTPEHLTRNY
jgi:hypothetical protein